MRRCIVAIFLQILALSCFSQGKEWQKWQDTGNVYLDKGQFKTAFQYFSMALGECSDSFRYQHPACAPLYFDLAICYQNLGVSAEAEKALLNAIELTPNTKGYRFDYYNYKNALARNYLADRKTEQAQKLYVEIAEEFKGQKADELGLYFYSILGIAECYSLQERYELAEPKLLQIINHPWKQDHFPVYRNLVGEAIKTLATNYATTEEYKTAEQLFESLVKMYPFEEVPVQYLGAQQDLGEFYVKIKDYKDGEATLKRVLFLMDSLKMDRPLERMDIYFKLGEIHEGYNETVQAEGYLKAACYMARRMFAANSIHFLKALGQLTSFYLDTGQLDSADKCLKTILPALLSNEEVTTSELLFFYNKQAMYYVNAGEWQLAENTLLKLLMLRDESAQKIEDYLTNYFNLAVVSYESGHYQKSYQYAANSFSYFKKYIKNVGSFASSTQQLTIINQQQALNSFFGNLAIKNTTQPFNDSINVLLYQMQFFSRAAILNSAVKSQQDPLNNSLRKAKELFAKGLSSSQLSTAYLLQLQKKIDSIEKAIRYRDQRTGNADDENAVYITQKNLKPGETIIDCNRITLFRNGGFTDTAVYTAIISSSDSPLPKFIVLCTEKLLEEAMRLNETEKFALHKDNLPYKELHRLVWKPLHGAIGNDSSFYVLPIGLLTKISFASIYGDDDKPLVMRNRFTYLSSLKGLEKTQIKVKSSLSALLLGDVTYYANYESATSTAPPFLPFDWDQLTYTKEEVSFIAEKLAKQKYSVQLMLGSGAEEKQLKVNIKKRKPSIIHFATHGYFLNRGDFSSYKDPTQKQAWVRNNAFLTNGLLLAGGGDAWNGKSVDTSRDDGILTALEVSDLDLSETDLVVLSACESGSGQAEGLEGVYGLQRSLRIAGSKNSIVSLWTVSDKETAILMKKFYQNLLDKKMTPSDALLAAQRTLALNYDPRSWASFVLIQ